jgi:flagellar FliL protein
MSAPAESPATDAAPDAPKSAKSVPLVLLLTVVVGLAAGGGAGAVGAGPLLAAGIAPAAQATARAARAQAAATHDGDSASADEEGGESSEGAAEGGGHGAKEGGAEGASAPVYTLDNLVLNPAGSDGTRFLLVTISLQVKDAATLEAMKGRDAELRDAVLVTVGNRTVEQLASVAARDSLKAELQAAAKKLFRRNVVRRVYFPQFVIQ